SGNERTLQTPFTTRNKPERVTEHLITAEFSCFHASMLPCFHASMLPCFHALPAVNVEKKRICP
ncbi:TPA: hypothetical protein ACNJX6_005815, partial [Salmonella enterica subsp. enterica serovar Newport]